MTEVLTPENPLPLAVLGLWPTVIGALVFGLRVASCLRPRTVSPLIFAAGLGGCAWLSAVHVFGLVTHSFRWGLVLGALTVGLAGAAVAKSVWRERQRWLGVPQARSRWLWTTCALTTAFVGQLAWRYHFHDELSVHGHMGVVAQFQNDVYPPRNLSFPAVPLSYHYAVTLAAACVSALLRLRNDHALDVVTMAGWALTWSLLWQLGWSLAGRFGAPLLPFVSLLCGGFAATCPTLWRAHQGLGGHLTGFCSQGGSLLSASPLSNVFQHPWSVGFPVVGLLLAVHVDTERRARVRWLVLPWLVAFLSLCQITLFFAVVPSLVAAELIHEFPRRRGLFLVVAAAVGVLGAWSFGGFFSSNEGVGLGLIVRAWIAGDAATSGWWVFQTIGWPLVLGLLGLLFFPRGSVVFGLTALGSLIVLNGFAHAFSWDIVKFAQTASWALAFPATVLLVRAFRSRRLPVLGPAFAVGSLIVSAAGPLAWAGALTFELEGIVPMYLQQPPRPTFAEVQAMEWLRGRLKPGEIVYRRNKGYSAFAVWGGIPQLWFDAGQNVPPARVERRNRLLASWPAEATAYKEEGVRYFVMSEDDGPVGAHVARWVEQGLAQPRAAFESLRVVELL